MSYVKTVWDETVGVTPARLNNLETQYEKSLVDAVPQSYDGRPEDVTITAGAGQTYPTISAALSTLKKVNAGKRIIQCVDGHNEPAGITISGFHGGTIEIISTTGAQLTVNGTISISDNTAKIWLGYITLAGASSFFNCQNNVSVTLYTCRNILTGLYGVWCYTGGFYYLTDCIFSNHTSIAIDAQNGAVVNLNAVTGTGNAMGISSNGALVTKSADSTITGTTAISKINGGQVFV